MSYLNDSPETLANLMRLKGLRGLGNRKTPQPSYSALDTEAPDLAMTGMQEEVNVPMADEAGGYMPESYDVRANEIISEPSMFEKLGNAFGTLLKGQQLNAGEIPPPAMQEQITETMQPAPQADMASPPERPTQPGEVVFGGIGRALKSWLGGPTQESQDEIASIQEAIRQRQGGSVAGIPITDPNAPPVSELAPQIQQQRGMNEQAIRDEAIRVAQERPWMDIVYGATNEVAMQPELVRQISDYTGINFDEQLQAQVAEAEKVLADLDKPLAELMGSYSQDELALRQRIESNQTNQSDKILIGFSLLMPVLIGGLFGAEAGLGALAGGAQGFGEVLQGREKNIRSDEDALRELQKSQANLALKRGELDLERLKLPQEIRKNLPKDETAHLKGKQEQFIDPQTGEIKGGKVIYPDFVIPNEDLQDKDDVKFYKKEAKTLANEKASLKEANDITRELAEAAVQLEDPNLILRAANAWLLDDGDPKKIGLIGQIKKQSGLANAPEITIQGRKVNAYNYLGQKLERLNDLYRRTTGMRALTNTVAQHFEGLIANPIGTGIKTRDFIEQILSLREGRQKSLIEEAHALGFYKEPLMDAFSKENKEFYDRLNLKSLEDKFRKAEQGVRGKK